MKTCTTTWFPCYAKAVIMSELALQTLKTLETIELQEIQALQYIVTIPHDWLVKRVFVYIIVKRVMKTVLQGVYTAAHNSKDPHKSAYT